MAWDTEGTRRKLLAAGAQQFAAHGFAGARMDVIGREAGVNKERVYQYFGNKHAFYLAVLTDQLDSLLEGADVRGGGAEAMGDFAGALFDRFQADATPARLLAWESLELEHPASTAERANLCARRASSIRDALPGVDQHGAEHLLLSIVTLAAGWWTLSHLAGVVLTTPADDSQRRRQLVRQATALARAAHDAV
ncbi:TetR/AcrR family transcriptional regulator [Microbacterium marinilacus]|uniref:TetR family transcriptional regulator n=1 Tax=Microbacterium marinilacus TaxID=415209 RepID=A0ABP7B2C9_9MICO|nr:TetR/AcrR family transcriptional regulator [Microbacterium marinilacus]MBY0688662.1 TetR/AcrR family transcriptional regulator [Microbacterium marinilacus]